jgi:hypothetical protein
MSLLTGGRARWAALGVIVFGLAASGIAYASIPDADGTIRACYMKSGGALHVIDASVNNCKSGETSLTWNQTGPTGPAGPTGPQGPPGSARAWALINGGSSPTVDATRSRNVTGVGFGSADYCVFLDPSIDPNRVAAVASTFFSPAVAGVSAGGCAIGDQAGIEVIIRNLDGTPDTADSFYLVVP